MPGIASNIIYEDVPDMPESDLVAVMQWIKNRTTGVKLPFAGSNPNRGVLGRFLRLAQLAPKIRAGYATRNADRVTVAQ